MEKYEHEYNAEQIQVLEGLEAVRKRPGMYIGSVSIRGLHHLVYEIVDNCVDEALAGYCTQINIKLEPGNIVSVEDNGRGIHRQLHRPDRGHGGDQGRRHDRHDNRRHDILKGHGQRGQHGHSRRKGAGLKGGVK